MRFEVTDLNYYNEIKNKLIDDEIYQKTKDYSKEKHRVITYFEIGKLLSEAGKHYGENIIGKNCKIGKNVIIENSILWDNIKLADNIHIKNSIIASNEIVAVNLSNKIIGNNKLVTL